MSVSYDGKQPSKLWYFWQKTKAMVQTPFNFTTRKDAGRFGIDAGKTAGVLALGNLALMVPVIAATPILPWVVGGVAITFAFKFGRSAWDKFKGLKETAFVSNYVRDREENWLDKKKNGGGISRMLKDLKAKLKIPQGVLKVAKWAGLAGAVTGLAGAATVALAHFAAIPALAPVVETVVALGAGLGLTAGVAVGVAIGAAALAIPVGLGVFVAARNATTSSETKESPFKFKKPAPDGQPIDQGRVFEGKSKSFDFNDNAPPAKPAKDGGLTEARRKAAAEREKNKSRRDNSKKF